MTRTYIKYCIVFLLFSHCAFAQLLQKKERYTRADTLRGKLTPLRTCYDINYYHLDLKVEIERKFISGSNLFRFTATKDFDKLQFDLFENLSIEKILYQNKELRFSREFGAVRVQFPKTIKKGSKDAFKVFYSGHPTVAKNAPWDGGFIFSNDKNGNPWVAVACQGFGASSWWPNKDHQSDEVDSMMISIAVPQGLMDVSNGRLRSTEKLTDGYVKHNWFVSYPINNYSVTLNIGDFASLSDRYQGEKGELPLDYFVLKENLEKAKKHFATNVKPMLKCFEHWFGPYPFYRDGFKLIDAPFLGMEHQSAVAYGNEYKNGYKGTDLSGTGLGMTWDYIIVHEAGHEWFGNNITSKDIADMWIHEAFTMYSEGLLIECQKNKEACGQYIAGIRRNIQNDIPIIGPHGVNKEGSGDMYYKGANLVQILRTVIDNDEKFKSILRGLNKDLGLKTTTTEEVIKYIENKSGKSLKKVFDQYLRHPSIPVFEIKKENKSTAFRWIADVESFDMPLRVKLSGEAGWSFIKPTTKWQTIKNEITEVDTTNFYIETKNNESGATSRKM